MLEKIIEKEEKMNKRSSNLINVELSMEFGRPIIIPFSDMHIGSKEFKKEEFERNLKWVYDNPNVYVIGNGDWMEAATRTSVGAGVYDQLMNPQEQMEQLVEYFKPLADEGRLLAITNGNHEDRIYKATGMDATKQLANLLGVKFFKEGGFFKIKVGDQNYDMYMTHGSSGATLPHTKIKKCLDLARFIDVDIYAMGHVHELQTHTQGYFYIDRRNKCIKEKDKYFVLTGHYLDYFDSYAQSKSMIPSQTGTPKIKLSGDKHQIRVSL